ncbi:MAG TPA: hypothetical protein VHQ90_24500 [Thermoanaerobaculia bacterium]|nr:hypothetical protein [Thermoanaerobaculia bacterium]
MVELNAYEWLLAEGAVEVGGVFRRVMDLVLGAGGPPLLVEQRSWLEALARHPLKLYEVQEAVPGEGVRVKEVVSKGSAPVWVQERSASQNLVRWEILGARLIEVGEDRWEFSGGVYPLVRESLPVLIRRLRAVERKGGGASSTIIDAWLEHLTAPPRPAPKLVDARTGDALLLVTDHYRVKDWDGLAARLAAQPDVEGNRRDGWVRYLDDEDELLRSIRYAVNLGKGRDRIEIFARTRNRAEEAASWFQEVAGDAAVFMTRAMTDPAALFTQRREQPRQQAPEASPRLPQGTLEHLYRRWADEPVPALGNRTPRQAVRTAAGREKVVNLLKDYERHDRRRARQEGHEPASWRFLWDKLGLTPE